MSQPRLSRSEVLEVTKGELDAAGYSYREERGGKHPRLVVDVNGREEAVILSGTPSDWRSKVNAKTQVRRKIREWNTEMEPQMELVTQDAGPNFDLIAPQTGEIGGSRVPTVNARDLHTFFCVKSEFRNWVKNRISDFGFQEGVDFTTTVEKYRGGERRHYHVSLDMAKELSMVERNEMGRAARRYFIECERQLREQSNSPSVARNDDAILDLIVAGNQDMLSAQSRSAQDLVEHVEGGKAAVLRYLKMYVRETLDGMVSYQADFRESTRRRDQMVLDRLKAMERAVSDLMAKAEQPLLSRPFAFSEWYDHDRIYRDFFPNQDIPNRRFLSQAITKSLDAYCKKRQRGFDMQSRNIGGRNVNLWHKDSVEHWVKLAGQEMVRKHLAKSRRDPVVVAFTGAR